jgi:hypothetical protein
MDVFSQFFLQETTYIILKQHSYKKALYKGAYYIKVLEGHKSGRTTEVQIAGGRLQGHHRCMEPGLRKSLARRRLDELVDDVMM